MVYHGYYKDKNFGFYGKGFRSTHAQSLNFNYRKANTVGHPNARFGIGENDFFGVYDDLSSQAPTPEDFYKKTNTYGCDDHRLKMASDEKNSQRSSKAKQFFEKRKEFLKEEIARAEKLEYAYDDLVSDITELFLEW